MDKAQIKAWISEQTKKLQIDHLSAAHTITVALIAAWMHEQKKIDIAKFPASDVARWIDTAMQGDEETFSRLEALEQRFARKPPLALIALDADQIQAYVFESAKIPVKYAGLVHSSSG